MACPLFIPHAPLGELVSVATPLGDLYGGACSAAPSAIIENHTLRLYCNFGYARGYCPRADLSDANATRFMVSGASGGNVNIAWAVERNHHPVAVGNMEIETGLPPGEDLLERQAHACARSFIRQTNGVRENTGQIAAAAHP